jgi:hypothetical protein
MNSHQWSGLRSVLLATTLAGSVFPVRGDDVPQTLRRPDDRVPLSPGAIAELKKLERPIVLRGDFLRASIVAWDDFLQRKTASLDKDKGRPDFDPASAELLEYLLRMESYDIRVEKSSSQIIVYIGATLRENAPIVFGGDARYWIDSHTFKISKSEHYK